MSTGARHAPLVLACMLAFASPARAFSDPLSFSDPVGSGGGGGRFFTGSARDGYGCAVCHSGAPAPRVTITGLPLAGYRPGAAYETRVEWPAALEHVGLELEITDSTGAAAGELRLPPLSELPNEERCEPVEDGFHAGELIEHEQRVMLSVVDCGAKRVRFLWIAPVEARGALRFSGGLVASDGEADTAGDGVTQFVHALPPAGDGALLASETRGGCSVQAARAPYGYVSALLMLLAATLSCSRSRRRSRRARR